MDSLIDRLKRQDEAALSEVMRVYKAPVFRFLQLMLGNREEAEELTQDTFVRVYFKAHTLQGDNLRPWIYAIAANLAHSRFRRRKLQRWLPLDGVPAMELATYSSPDTAIMIRQALDSLPEKYRMPLIMKEVESFSFEEMAEVLDRPVGTLKSLVFRGKEMIRSRMARAQGGEHV